MILFIKTTNVSKVKECSFAFSEKYLTAKTSNPGINIFKTVISILQVPLEIIIGRDFGVNGFGRETKCLSQTVVGQYPMIASSMNVESSKVQAVVVKEELADSICDMV